MGIETLKAPFPVLNNQHLRIKSVFPDQNLIKMEKPFFCLGQVLIRLLDFLSGFKDFFGGIKEAVFLGFLCPFHEALVVALIVFDPV